MTAFIFDMDGTLFRTDTVLARSLEDAFGWLAENGRWQGEAPVDVYRGIMGVPLPEVWRTLLPHETDAVREQMNAIFHERLIDNIRSGNGALYPHVEELFAFLKQEGHSIFIASNGLTVYLAAIVDVYGLDRWVTETFSIERTTTLDKGDLVGMIAEKYGISHGLVIGDRLSDINAAKANGFTSIGCRFDFAQEAELAEADRIIGDLFELKQLIPELQL